MPLSVHIRLWLSVLFYFAAVFWNFAQAQERPCTPIANIKAAAAQSRVSFAQVTDPKAIELYVALFNAMPPAGNDSYSVVYLGIKGETTTIFVGNGDMLCGHVDVPANVLQQLLDRVTGRAI